MTIKTKFTLILPILMMFLVSCDKPSCTNQNVDFDINGLETIEYKQELVKELNKLGSENITYWLSGYTQKNGKEFILIDLQNSDMCAQALLQVNDWDQMEGIKRTKGISYLGAQLQGLTFDVFNNGESIDFIFKGVKNIID